MAQRSKRSTTNTPTSAQKAIAMPSAPTRGKKVSSSIAEQPPTLNRIAAARASTDAMLKSRGKPLDFVLPGLLVDTVGIVVGGSGVGKSHFALQNAISVGIGRDIFNFWGDPENPFCMKKGKVMYISAEDGEDVVTQRLQNACKELSSRQRRAVKENVHFFFPQSFSIVTRQDGVLTESDWIRDLHAELCTWEERPRLIIVDTLNRSLGDANENSASGMAKIEEALKRIAVTYGCGVQLVHHALKGSGDAEAGLKPDVARGSSAAVCNVRSMINLALDDTNPNVIWYALSKANYGPKPPIRFAIRNSDGVLFGAAQHPEKILPVKSVGKKGAENGSAAVPTGKKNGGSVEPGAPRNRGKPHASAHNHLN